VTEILELAQLLQDDRVTQVDVRSRRIDAELDPQGLTAIELAFELAGRQCLDCVAK
jgi:hypothetical protein